MTYQYDFTLPTELLEQVAEQGLDFIPELVRIVVNTAMQVERQKHLGVGPYERSGIATGIAACTAGAALATRQRWLPTVGLLAAGLVSFAAAKRK